MSAGDPASQLAASQGSLFPTELALAAQQQQPQRIARRASPEPPAEVVREGILASLLRGYKPSGSRESNARRIGWGNTTNASAQAPPSNANLDELGSVDSWEAGDLRGEDLEEGGCFLFPSCGEVPLLFFP